MMCKEFTIILVQLCQWVDSSQDELIEVVELGSLRHSSRNNRAGNSTTRR